MAIRKIRLDPDPILRKISREVEVVDDSIKELVEDMLETMRENNGAGLAAPQIGILRRIAVVEVDDRREKKKDENGEDEDFNIITHVLINPVITKTSEEVEIMSEGCLSFPDLWGKVKRPKYLTVEALDENGKKQVIEAEGYLARAIAHEVDHLNGVLFIDLVEEGTLEVVEK